MNTLTSNQLSEWRLTSLVKSSLRRNKELVRCSLRTWSSYWTLDILVYHILYCIYCIYCTAHTILYILYCLYCTVEEEEERLTHCGMCPPSGSWWWYCRTRTVAMTDRPTITMVVAKYWAETQTANIHALVSDRDDTSDQVKKDIVFSILGLDFSYQSSLVWKTHPGNSEVVLFTCCVTFRRDEGSVHLWEEQSQRSQAWFQPPATWRLSARATLWFLQRKKRKWLFIIRRRAEIYYLFI